MPDRYFVLARGRHDRPFQGVATAATFDEAEQIERKTPAYESTVVHEAAITKAKVAEYEAQIGRGALDPSPRCVTCGMPENVPHDKRCRWRIGDR